VDQRFFVDQGIRGFSGSLDQGISGYFRSMAAGTSGYCRSMAAPADILLYFFLPEMCICLELYRGSLVVLCVSGSENLVFEGFWLIGIVILV
jgi:hypothetical protein